MTARDDVLAAARALHDQGNNRFTVAQVQESLVDRGVQLPEPVVELLVTSAMCLYGEGQVRVRYDDLVQVGRDRYRVAEGAGGEPIVSPERQLTAEEILRGRFSLAVTEAVGLVKPLTDYNPTGLKADLAEWGALTTAKRILADDEVSEGFDALWGRRRLDLTVEWQALVFHDLFTREERQVAYDRLVGHDLPIDDWLVERLGRRYP